MSISEVNGVVSHKHSNRKTDYLFRISMKSLIRNDAGEILVVKESGRDWWDLPGGGMDHDENIYEALCRELYEEVSLTGDFTYKIIAIEDPSFLEHAKVWQIRTIFAVTPQNMTFLPGEDADDVRFIDPALLKDSSIKAEQCAYQYSLIV